MRLWLSLILISALSFNASADLTESIQGATKKEREIRWLWKHLPDFIESCLRSNPECLEPKVKAILSQLDPSNYGSIQFVSEKIRPELFSSSSNEAHRVAVTELQAGAVIYINTDRMESLTNAQWVGLLTHEAVHHLGITDGADRLPDTLGVAVASHAEKNWSETTMAEFGHPDDNLIIFSDPAGQRVSHFLINVGPFSADNSLAPNSRVPVCAAGETFIGQTVSAPLLRVGYVRGDKKLAKLRVSARVMNTCKAADGEIRAVPTALTAALDLNFKQNFTEDEAWWELPSTIDFTSLVAGNNDGKEVEMDIYRSFTIESIHHEKPRVQAGSVWKSQVIVESTDGMVPSQCVATHSGSKWFYHRTGNLVMFNVTDECKIISLGGNRWQLNLSHKVPPNLQGDLFYLNFIYLTDGTKEAYAIPVRPDYVRIENSQIAPPLKAGHWRVLGLQPRTSYNGTPLWNSYTIQRDVPFWFEFDVYGKQKIGMQFFDFDYFVKLGGTDVLMPWNPMLEQLSKVVLKTETKDIPGGMCIRYLMVLPSTPVSGQIVHGFKFRRLSLEGEDKGWVEFEIPKFNDSMFLLEGY